MVHITSSGAESLIYPRALSSIMAFPLCTADPPTTFLALYKLSKNKMGIEEHSSLSLF